MTLKRKLQGLFAELSDEQHEQVLELLQEAFHEGRQPGAIDEQSRQAKFDRSRFIHFNTVAQKSLLDATDCAELTLWYMDRLIRADTLRFMPTDDLQNPYGKKIYSNEIIQPRKRYEY